MKILLVCPLLALLFFCFRSSGATISAKSPSLADVQDAIERAAPGDTVSVPAGSATWSAQLVLAKGVLLQGAGPGKTTITQSTSASVTALSFDIPSGQTGTVSGFTFKSANSSCTNGIISCGGEGWRLTNCTIQQTPPRALTIWGHAKGLIDHCGFENNNNSGQGVSFMRDASYTLTNCPPWFTPQPYGTLAAAVVEDCTFNFNAGPGDGAFDAYDGAIFVFRHNTVNGTNIGWHGADSAPRAPRLFEVYENTISNSGAPIYVAIRVRGGTGVIWGNTISGAFNGFIQLSAYRADPSYNGNPGPLGSKVDGNFHASGKPGPYPILDQVGRGSFPPDTPWPNQTSYTQAEYGALEPMYQWANTYKGTSNPTAAPGGPDQSADYIRPGVDYYDNVPKPGYRPLEYPHPLTRSGGAPSPSPSPTPSASPTPSSSPVPTPTPVQSPSPAYEKWIKEQNDWIRSHPPYSD